MKTRFENFKKKSVKDTSVSMSSSSFQKHADDDNGLYYDGYIKSLLGAELEKEQELQRKQGKSPESMLKIDPPFIFKRQDELNEANASRFSLNTTPVPMTDVPSPMTNSSSRGSSPVARVFGYNPSPITVAKESRYVSDMAGPSNLPIALIEPISKQHVSNFFTSQSSEAFPSTQRVELQASKNESSQTQSNSQTVLTFVEKTYYGEILLKPELKTFNEEEDDELQFRLDL